VGHPRYRGEAVICLALTEPGAGSDAASLSTKATRVDVAGGSPVRRPRSPRPYMPMSRSSSHRPNPGRAARASDCSSSTWPIPGQHQPIRDPGFKPLGRGSIFLDDVFVPDSHVLGEIGRGFGMVMHEFDLSRTLIALMNIGTAQHALDMAIEYSKQRQTFGRPLAANQGVSFVIAEHSTYVSR